MGGFETGSPDSVEPTLKYHPDYSEYLTRRKAETLSGGEFDWGGRLPKCNGGAQRSPQLDWKPSEECNGIRGLNCERDTSSRYESRS